MSKFSVGETVWVKPIEEIEAVRGAYIPPAIHYFCDYQ